MKQVMAALLISLALFLTSSFAHAQNTEVTNTAKVILYRSGNDGGKPYGLTSQNAGLAKLKKGEKFEQVLAAGTYYYMADPATKQVFKIELQAGQTYYVKVGRDGNFFKGQPSLKMRTVQQYRQDLVNNK